MDSRITIAVPNRNNERYLAYCLSSIALQTERPAHVIVSDNHSNDRSAEILSGFRDVVDDVLEPPDALSYMQHLRWILEHVRSEYVIFLAGDDFLNPGIIKAYGKLISQRNDFSFICSPFYFINERTQLLGKIEWSQDLRSKANIGDVFLRGPICNISSVAWNTKKLQSVPILPEEMGNCVDYYYYIFLSANRNVGLVFEKFLYYRVHSGSTGARDVKSHTKKCKSMLTWVKENRIISNMNPEIYSTVQAGFNDALAKEKADPEDVRSKLNFSERWLFALYLRELERKAEKSTKLPKAAR